MQDQIPITKDIIMKNKAKNKPKSKRPKLPKYGKGGPIASLADQQAMDAQERANMNFSSGAPTNQQYAQYGAATAQGIGAYQSTMNGADPNADRSQTQAQAINNGIDSIAGSITPWYGYAKQASNMGKNMVKTNTITDPTTGKTYTQARTGEGQATRDAMTPLHETVVNDLTDGNYGRAALDTITGGQFTTLDNYWNHTNKNNFDAAKRASDAANTPAEVFNKDYRQDSVWQKLNNHQTFAMGGMNGMPNAELEKQEVMQYPDGSTNQVNGPSHENGGIPINLPPATKVYSDKLKLPGSKITVAKEAEKYKTDKEDKILANDKADNTSRNTAKLTAQIKQRKLDELFEAQETFKQEKVAKYAAKMGVTLPNKPMMRNGGMLPKYADGALTPMTAEDPELRANPYFTDDYMRTSQRPSPFYQTPMQPMQSLGLPIQNNGTPDQLKASGLPSEATMGEDPYKEYDPNRTMNIMEGVSNGLIQNAGNFYDLYKSRFGAKYDRENYGQVNPNLANPKTIDARESLRDADRQSAASRYALRQAVGGNAGAYMANLAANQNTNTINKAKIREDVNNTNTNILNNADAQNASIKNQFGQYNKELKIREMTANSQNKARSEDMAAHAVRDMGSKFASSYKDYKEGDMDQKKLTLINQYFPDYKFDPNTYEMYYNAATAEGSRSKSKPRRKR